MFWVVWSIQFFVCVLMNFMNTDFGRVGGCGLVSPGIFYYYFFNIAFYLCVK